jgi:serine-type D-Ala-D-Ala carboxypeptidase (penicillin-binding protein 5/6)
LFKKFFSVITTALMVSLFFSTVKVKAEKALINKEVPYINARCAIAIDSKTKIVLYEKSSASLVPMASTTKIITALVALKYGDLDKKVLISEKASQIRGSTVGYKRGEYITLKELVHGLMLRSGNDAAIAIAEGISGSIDEFLKLMNEYAAEIGLLDTHFESPHGLDSANHYTTAYDLAVATAKAKEIKKFNEIVSSKDIDAGSAGFTRSFHNINKILWQMPTANGVKTGYTGQAGKCLVSSIGYDNKDIIIVILNSNTRWKETQKIYDYIVKEYEYKLLANKDDIVDTMPVKLGSNSVNLKCTEEIMLPLRKSSVITKKIIVSPKVVAPISKGEKCGRMDIFEDDKLIYTTVLESDNNVPQKGILKRLFEK